MPGWMVYNKKADFDGIAAAYGIHPVTARLIRNRDVTQEEEIRKYLCGDLSDLYDPALLQGAVEASGLLVKKIREGAKLRIIGDYDVDGITATYILLKGISSLGGIVDYMLPHRINDGYGLNKNLVQKALDDGIDTIITCDNGIAAFDEIAFAKEQHLTVILTDHHEVPTDENGAQIIPCADAVVNPKCGENGYPFPAICGAVVAFKLLQIVYRALDRENDPVFDELLECAAIATVCDVMPLINENRIIVREGLSRLKNSANAGLKALMRVTGLEEKKLSAYSLGFVIGPCLNAGGRLDSATRGVELLRSETVEEALSAATALKDLNEARKDMTKQGVLEASKIIGQETKGTAAKILVVFLPNTHESVAGIIAGRLREQYMRPVIVFTRAEEGIKGSGRSVPAYDMYKGLLACADLFTKFGGHPMAAGLSMEEKHLDSLRQRLNDNCTLQAEEMKDVLHLDMELPPSVLTASLIREWVSLEPFGNGNERPLFAARNIRFINGRRIGKTGSFAKYRVADEQGSEFELIHFGAPERFEDFLRENFGAKAFDALYAGALNKETTPVLLKIAYRPEINAFRGREQIQLVMEDYIL